MLNLIFLNRPISRLASVAAFAFGLVAWSDGVHLAVAQPVPPRRVAINLGGKLVDHNEFRIVGPHLPFCPVWHYHAKTNQTVTALDGSMIADPQVVGCGYAPLGGLSYGVVYDLIVPDADYDGVPDLRELQLGLDPNNPDSNGNGVFDGDEDNDGDFLTNIEEIILFATSPINKDSDGNGIQDNVQVTIDRTKKDFTVIPVLVNIHPKSTVDTDYARDSVENANKVLKKGNIRLEIVSVNENATFDDVGDDGTGGATADDGVYNFEGTRTEFLRALGEGVDELKNQKNKKGIKLIFARDGSAGGVLEDVATPGASLHKYPVIIAQKRDSVELTGSSIAHELGHALTLKEHPSEDENANADDKKPGNWMNPSVSLIPNDGTGRDDFVTSTDPDKGIDNVQITERQRAIIHGSADGTKAGASHSYVQRWGIQGTMNSPAVQIPYSIGHDIDPIGDQAAGAPDHADLATANVSSNGNLDSVDFAISMNALFDDTPFASTLSILLDTDDNQSTGLSSKGMTGVDREITIIVERLTAADPVVANAFLNDYDLFQTLTLAPAPIVSILEQLFDLNEAGTPLLSGIDLRVPKDFLNLTADDVPVSVVSSNVPSNPGEDVIYDSMMFNYDRDAWELDPVVTLFDEFADGGEQLAVEIANLGADAPFELMVDGEVVVSDIANGDGQYIGQLLLPDDLTAGLSFVTVRSDGLIGVSAVTIRPSPGDFDSDGDSDGFDFLAWQRGESPVPLSSMDLATWEANFGTVFGAVFGTPATSTAIPEPSAWIALLSGAVALLRLRRG